MDKRREAEIADERPIRSDRSRTHTARRTESTPSRDAEEPGDGLRPGPSPAANPLSDPPDDVKD